MHEALVRMRNHKVSISMQKKYRTLTSDFNLLQINFVSNTSYNAHKEGVDEEEIPLSISLTGIPQLRYTISQFPAQSRIHVLEQYFKRNLQSTIDQMELWSLQTTIQRRLELRTVIEKRRQVIFLSFIHKSGLISKV